MDAPDHVHTNAGMTVLVPVVDMLVLVDALVKHVKAVVVHHVALMGVLQHAMSTVHQHVRHHVKKRAILHVKKHVKEIALAVPAVHRHVNLYV